MTQDEIIRMAMDIDGHINDWNGGIDLKWDVLVKIVQTAIKNEREACAKVCEETKAPKIRDEWSAGQMTGCSSCAAAIRARGEK